ncbi:hypothetical protein [Bradyrhizobium sp. CB1015]|uniref:hypothetical protein n=1 Tax=Bradyrhizobium sp. CB1015 TaxID=2976822 RepID=UPI0021AA4EF1|nr:hypothetical protein [Bradyrhizobium sp. CB1015]UWU92919.1 hypothetical protein N2604_02875 [Bradyrhizobium sp. CB1015]
MNKEQFGISWSRPGPTSRPPIRPMFTFDSSAKVDARLAIVAGGLILDLGEAERTFIYRCQDRFLTYTSLWQARSIFFALNDRHVETYRQHVGAQRLLFDHIRDRTGLFSLQPLLEPLYVGCNIDNLRVFACRGFSEQVQALRPVAGFMLNQISPTYAMLLAQLAQLLRLHGMPIDDFEADAADLADLAAVCANKSDYLALASTDHRLPRHSATIQVAAADLWKLADYSALAAFYRSCISDCSDEPARLFVKATLNSSGNLSALVGPDTYVSEMKRLRTCVAEEADSGALEIERQANALRQEVDLAPCLKSIGLKDAQLASCKREQALRRKRVDFLVQPALSRRDGDDSFAGIGLSYMLTRDGGVMPFGPTAQIYRDRDHKHFQGAYLSDLVGRDIPAQFHDAMTELCRRYLARGYHGPINFDAHRTREGNYELIYDCNPRLTGVFPSLAVRDALQDDGIAVESVLTLGYRGEFVLNDLDAALEGLDRSGLLLTRHRSSGVVLLPNLCRDRGFDLHLINLAPANANELLDELGSLSVASVHPTRLYW